MYQFFETLLRYPIIPIFLLGNLLIALWAHSKSKIHSFLDYAIASRNLPTAVLVMTLLGTYLSSSSLGKIDRFFAYGLVHILPSISVFFSFLLIGTFLAPKLVHFSNKTAGGLMGTFYGPGAQMHAGLMGFLFCLLVITAQISALGKISSIMLEVDFTVSILFFCGLAVLYSTFGGFRSVSYTDVMQLIVVLFFFGLVTFNVLHKVGGVMALIEKLQVPKFSEKLTIVHNPNFYFRVKSAIFWGCPFSLMMSPPIVHRMLITQDKSEVKRMWYTGAFIFTTIIISSVVIAFALLVDKDSLGVSETKNLLPYLVKALFTGKPMLFGLMFIGMISVMLSTIDSFLHTAGIILIEDIIAGPIRYFSKKEPIKEEKKVWYAKLGIALIGICAILIGIHFDTTLRGMSVRLLIPAVLIYAPINIPLVLGILGLKTDRYSWTASLFTFFGTLSILNALEWKAALGNHAYYDYFMIALPLSIVSYLVTHLYINRGIVLIDRQRHTVSELLWVRPSRKRVFRWLCATFNFSAQARKEVVYGRPIQDLIFSLLIFSLYMLRSIVCAGDNILTEFLGTIHFIGIVLCCFLMLGALWPVALKPYLPLYWFVTLLYCLPLSSTLMFLHRHEGLGSLLFFVGSFGLLSYLVSSRVFAWMSVSSLILGHLGWYIVNGSLPEGLAMDMQYMIGLLVVFVLILCVLTFVGGSEHYTKNRFYMQKAFASAISHEIRNPLTAISFVGFASDKISKMAEPINKDGEAGFFVSKKMQSLMADHGNKITTSLNEVQSQFNKFQEILDGDVSTAPQEIVSMKALIQSLLPTLSKSYTEEMDVSLVCTKDFQARLIKSFFSNILENILKNAQNHGDAKKIEIRIDGRERKVYIRDNGQGIAKDVLPHIFKLRFTKGGTNNSGVGLALIHFILASSGIKISCQSRQGDKASFTEFVMTFPLV